MTIKTPSLLVPTQVPEFIVNDGKKFIEFIQAYYEFNEQYAYDIERLRDVDSTTPELVQYLAREYAAKFPKSQVSTAELIKLIRKIYVAKGTEEAIKLMFRLFYATEVNIVQPNKSILRASDGRWEQTSYFYVRSVFGTFEDTPVFRIRNEFGEYFIETTSSTYVDGNTRRYNFKRQRSFVFEEGQYVDVYDELDNLTFKGVLLKSPSTLRVAVPGRGWKRGQIVVIPGEVEDTLAKVSTTGPNGELVSLEIVRYGIGHAENQSTLTNPYVNKPSSGSSTTIDTQLVGVIAGEPFYEHIVTVEDFTDGLGERVIGVSSGADDPESYFMEDYNVVGENYNGRQVIRTAVDVIGSTVESVGFEQELTLEDWRAALTTLVYDFDYVVNEPGKYVSEDSHLSNQNIRLQDNYYYQLFSYVIETTRQLSEYQGILGQIHPAGLKFFGSLQKTATFYGSFANIVFRFLSQDKLYPADFFDVADYSYLEFIKAQETLVDAIDGISSFLVLKSPVDNAYVETDQQVEFGFDKSVSSDNAVPVDTQQKNIGKAETESLTNEDSVDLSQMLSKADYTTDVDSITLNNDKVFDELAFIPPEISTYSDLIYVEPGYVEDAYVELLYILSFSSSE